MSFTRKWILFNEEYGFFVEESVLFARFFFQLDCCGIDDYRDWSQGDVWSDQSHVPDSCCIEEKVGCGKLTNGNETNGLIYTDVCRNMTISSFDTDSSSMQGCFNMIQKEINRNLMIVGILAFVLVFVEVSLLRLFIS